MDKQNFMKKRGMPKVRSPKFCLTVMLVTAQQTAEAMHNCTWDRAETGVTDVTLAEPNGLYPVNFRKSKQLLDVCERILPQVALYLIE